MTKLALLVVFIAVGISAAAAQNPGGCLKDNEEFGCVPKCPPQRTCRRPDVDKHVSCPQVYPAPCEPKCACKQGYIRNDDGECVTEDKCTCSPNEELRCVPYCPSEKTCTNMDEQVSCPIHFTVFCENQCACKDGFFRNSNGACVARENCTGELDTSIPQ